jgi:hypothetical protein
VAVGNQTEALGMNIHRTGHFKSFQEYMKDFCNVALRRGKIAQPITVTDDPIRP